MINLADFRDLHCNNIFTKAVCPFLPYLSRQRWSSKYLRSNSAFASIFCLYRARVTSRANLWCRKEELNVWIDGNNNFGRFYENWPQIKYVHIEKRTLKTRPFACDCICLGTAKYLGENGWLLQSRRAYGQRIMQVYTYAWLKWPKVA